MNDKILNLLLKEANKAYKQDEIPVGAVITKNGKIIASSHNTKQKSHNVTGHAEINAIKKAAAKEKDWRLDEYTLYVTLEPCDMCKEVIRQSRIKNVYFLLESNYISENNKKISIKKEEISQEIFNNYKQLLKNYFSVKR